MSEKKKIGKCQNNEKVSPKWLCLPMAIIFGNIMLKYDRSRLRGDRHPYLSMSHFTYYVLLPFLFLHFTSPFRVTDIDLFIFSCVYYPSSWVPTPLSHFYPPTESKLPLYISCYVLLLIPIITVDTSIYDRSVFLHEMPVVSIHRLRILLSTIHQQLEHFGKRFRLKSRGRVPRLRRIR